MSLLLGLFKSRWLLYGAPALVVLMLAVYWRGYTSGAAREVDRQATAQLASVKQALRTQDALRARNDAIASTELSEAAARRVVYRTIDREVIRYVASTAVAQCADDAGLRLIHAAARGELPADPGEPARAVPGRAP